MSSKKNAHTLTDAAARADALRAKTLDAQRRAFAGANLAGDLRGFAIDRRRLRALVPPGQLVAPHRVRGERVDGPPAEHPAQVLDAPPGRVHRPIALEGVIFQVGAGHRVKGQRGAVGHRRQIEGRLFASTHRGAISAGRRPRPRASQTGVHTFARVAAEGKSVLRAAATRPHDAFAVFLGWIGQRTRTTPSTARSRSTRVCASAPIDR
jgi:hypothetical protein